MAAKIVELIAPRVANGGDTVIVDVHIKNTAAVTQFITATGVYDSLSLAWQFDYLSVLSAETVVFRGNFIMPMAAVVVIVYSWHWDGSQWVHDETRQASINVGIQDWYLVAETTKSIERPMVGVQGWYLVSQEAVLSVARTTTGVVGWQKVAETVISVQRTAMMIAGWNLVAERILTLTRPTMKPSPSKFPWEIAIVGAGIGTVAIVASMKKKP